MPQENAAVDVEKEFLVAFRYLNDALKLGWIRKCKVCFVFDPLDDVTDHDFVDYSFKFYVELRLANMLVDRHRKLSDVHKTGVLRIQRGQHFQDIAFSENVRHQLLQNLEYYFALDEVRLLEIKALEEATKVAHLFVNDRFSYHFEPLFVLGQKPLGLHALLGLLILAPSVEGVSELINECTAGYFTVSVPLKSVQDLLDLQPCNLELVDIAELLEIRGTEAVLAVVNGVQFYRHDCVLDVSGNFFQVLVKRPKNVDFCAYFELLLTNVLLKQWHVDLVARAVVLP